MWCNAYLNERDHRAAFLCSSGEPAGRAGPHGMQGILTRAIGNGRHAFLHSA